MRCVRSDSSIATSSTFAGPGAAAAASGVASASVMGGRHCSASQTMNFIVARRLSPSATRRSGSVSSASPVISPSLSIGVCSAPAAANAPAPSSIATGWPPPVSRP
jgi:hypothetical protein